jgi:hypothetical protein
MRIALAVIVAGVLSGGAGWAAAQQTQFPNKPLPVPPDIRTGADIGFRVEGKTRDGGVMGTFMVRLENGQWVEAQGTPWRGRLVPLETK